MAGLAGLVVPEQLNGAGLSIPAMARVMETLAGADFAFAFALVVHNNLAGSIANNGSEEQQQTYLPPMLAGKLIGAFLLTEPAGGSDAAAISTTAQPSTDGWVLNGAKAWISNATVADVLSVYATTDAEQGWRGIACFVIEAQRAGVSRGDAYELLGGHALGAGEFSFGNVALTQADLLLPPEQAFKVALAGIDLARVNVAAMCCGMLSSALEQAVDYCASRQVFGRSVAELQGVQWQLADAATDLAAARALTYQAATALQQITAPEQTPVTPELARQVTVMAAHAKKFATRMALGRISDCMQAMGAAGMRTDRSLTRHLACAKMAQYLDGTTEIQNVVISRELFDR
jgi:alkylation response protein AidB-like acyl-CoA dehydrogenase